MTLILGAAYSLWLMKRVVFGEIGNEKVAALEDLNTREFLMLGSLSVMVLVLGVWPEPLIELMHASVENRLQHVAVSKL